MSHSELAQILTAYIRIQITVYVFEILKIFMETFRSTKNQIESNNTNQIVVLLRQGCFDMEKRSGYKYKSFFNGST